MSRLPDFSTTARDGVPVGRADRLIVAGAALLLVAACSSAWQAHAQLERSRTALEQTRDALAQARQQERTLKAGRTSGDVAAAAREQLTAAAPPPQVLADLEGLFPAGVRLRQVTLTYADRLQVELQVTARAARDYDRLLDSLAGSPAFREVVTGPENREGEVRATLKTSYVGGAAR